MLGKLLLNLYFWCAFAVITIVGLTILPVILFGQVVFFSRTIPSGLRRAIRFYGWLLVCFVPFLSPVRVEYKNQKLSSAVIFVANHNSAIDPYLFGALAVENSFVTSWPFKIPIYSLLMRLSGYVNAEDGWGNVFKNCRTLLDGGSSVTIWPEGHRSRDGRLGRFRNGAFTLAVETGYPVVPVCILGAGDVMPPGSRMINSGTIKLIVLDKQYPVADLEPEVRVRELRNRVRNKMESMLEQNGHFRESVGTQGELC